MSRARGGFRIELGIIRPCRKGDVDPKRPKDRVCLYDSKGKRVLGRHRNRKGALRQERAIHVRKRGG